MSVPGTVLSSISINLKGGSKMITFIMSSADGDYFLAFIV